MLMGLVLCGWCHQPTDPATKCGACAHKDPALPWLQRGEEPPVVRSEPGRPSLDEHDIRRRYAEAKADLEGAHRDPTIEAIAERLDRSPRTVREWRKRYGLR